MREPREAIGATDNNSVEGGETPALRGEGAAILRRLGIGIGEGEGHRCPKVTLDVRLQERSVRERGGAGIGAHHQDPHQLRILSGRQRNGGGL